MRTIGPSISSRRSRSFANADAAAPPSAAAASDCSPPPIMASSLSSSEEVSRSGPT